MPIRISWFFSLRTDHKSTTLTSFCNYQKWISWPLQHFVLSSFFFPHHFTSHLSKMLVNQLTWMSFTSFVSLDKHSGLPAVSFIWGNTAWPFQKLGLNLMHINAFILEGCTYKFWRHLLLLPTEVKCIVSTLLWTKQSTKS